MRANRIAAAVLAVGLLGSATACTDAQLQQAQQVITTAGKDARAALQDAVKVYGVAKGIALVASAAFPEVGVVVGPIIALADPIAAGASAILAATTVDEAQAAQATAQLQAQAQQLTLAAAPSITVVANPAPASAAAK